MRMRGTIVAGTIAGLAFAGAAGPLLTTTAFADTPSPVPSESETTPTTPPPTPPPPDTRLDVTLTPAKAGPGDPVKIAAISHQGIFDQAVATSPVLGSVKLELVGEGAEGTGRVLTGAKAGVHTVTVNAIGHDGLKLSGTAQLTVVVTTPSPTPSPTTPIGGVGTGGGGTADGTNLGLITAGSALALLGISASVMVVRRRKGDAHD